MCLAGFKVFAQPYCLCRPFRIRNFVFPALVTAFSPRAILGFGVFKLRHGLFRKVPIDTMKTLYCSLVRPLLEYSCETWNPHTKRNIDKLEAVQRRATRWITRSDDDYDTRLSKLKLLSLSNRRFTRDVTFFQCN